MKFIKPSFFLLISLQLITNLLFAQPIEESKATIVRLNTAFENDLKAKNFENLAARYSDSAVYMPEYKPAINTRAGLKDFYTQWLTKVNIYNFVKKQYLVEAYGPYVLEIGQFEMDYTTPDYNRASYNGNYMVMWKILPTKRLTIVAEAFGSNKYLDAKDVPYNFVQVTNPYVLKQNRVSTQLLPHLIAFDSLLVRSVREGDPIARGSGFTENSIYIPHFGYILDGMKEMQPYLAKVYTPEAKLYTKNVYRELFQVDNFVFLVGHFTGGWGDAANGGKFEGNMFNLMYKDAKGQLFMHRQIANNDR